MPKTALSHRTVFLIISGLTNTLVNFIVGIILVRLLSKSLFGTYRQAFLAYRMISPFFLLAIPSSVLYFFPRLSGEKKKEFIAQTIMLLFFFGLLFAGVLFLGAGPISLYFNNKALKPLLMIFSFLPLFALPIGYFQSFLIAAEKFKVVALATILLSFTNTLSTIVPIALGYSLEVAFISLVVVTFFQLAVVLSYTRRLLGKFIFSFEWASIKAQFAYFIPLGLTAMVSVWAYDIDRLVVGRFFSTALFAVYVIGAVEVPLVQTIGVSVGNVLVPEFARLHKEGEIQEIVRIWRQAIRKMGLILLPIFFYLLVFAGPFITFLYTDRYWGSVIIFRIYLLLIPVRLFSFGLILRGIGVTRPILKGTVGYLVGNLCLNIIFVYVFGLVGPAIATVIVTLLEFNYFLFVVKKHLAIGWQQLVPWQIIARISLITAVASTVSLPFLLLNIPKVILLLASGAVFTAVYLLLAIYWGQITKADLQLAKDWFTLRVFKTG